MADYRLFPTDPTPSTPDAGYNGTITLGVRFRVTSAANVTKIWFYKAAANSGTHRGAIWSDAGVLQGSTVIFTGETASGWQSATFSSPIALVVGNYYRAGVYMPVGRFARAGVVHNVTITNGPLVAPGGGSPHNSCFVAPSAPPEFPNTWESTDGYGVDITVSTTDAPTTPTSLTATAVSSSQIDLTWTASTGGGGVTGYRVERCEGAGCSSFSEVGTPTTTTFSDTGLAADTSYSYRVRANSAGGFSSYSSTVTAVTAEPAVVGVVVRSVSSTVTFAGLELADVLSARGQVAADSGWPTCSVFVTAKPTTGNEEDDLDVIAGAGTNVTRFVGKVRRFKPSAFPKGIEIVATGTLAYANEWAPDTDLLFDEEFPSGATDQALVAWALGFVPGISYVGADIQGTGITLGTEAPEAFDWQAGVSAWQYVQQLDRATLYRTYQQHDGTIRRVQMIGHPSSTTTSFTLVDADILEGSSGSRNTEQTRNAAIVRGHDYGDGLGPVLGAGYGSNDFQGDGATAATRHPESFSSDLIEDGSDEDGTPLGYGGLDAQDIAEAILNDVNKEFVTADIRSWRDDEHGPGLTCLLDTLDRLAIGEKMWVQGYGWEVDDGWSVTYSLSGGGLEQAYEPPEV